MSRFSTIVPMLGSTSSFEETLASALRNRSGSCQLIVAHFGEYDDPYALAGEVDFVSVEPANSRMRKSKLIQLINAGLQVSRGDIVAVIRPGVRLPENWQQPISEAFSEPNVGSVSPAIVSLENPKQLVTAGVATNYRLSRKLVACNTRLNSRRTGRLTKSKLIGPTSWAAFYRRSLLTALGECDEQLDSPYLDVDLGLSLHSLDFGCVYRDDCVTTIEDAELILDESRLAHGKSAQRALRRHRELNPGQRRTRSFVSVISELMTAPFRPANLKQAAQRLGAQRLRSNDDHHQSLLSLLKSQRERLVETSLQVHQPASDSPKSFNRRRAA